MYAPNKTIEPREALINDFMLDMIANTDCSWYAATAAIAFWENHFRNGTAPVYGVVDYSNPGLDIREESNVVYDRGTTKRSLKIGVHVGDETVWMLTLQS